MSTEKKNKKRRVSKHIEVSDSNFDNTDNNVNAGYETPISSNINNEFVITNSSNTSNEETVVKNENESNKLENPMNDDMVDIFHLYDTLKNDKSDNLTAAFSNTGNQTVVDVVKIFSSTIQGVTLVAFVLSNFYGGRHYINDRINKTTKLMYHKTVESICSDKVNIPDKSDVSYLVHKNNRPIVLVSSIPQCESIYHMESIKETLQTLVDTFQGKPDPENKGKVFKFNFMNDFIMKTHQQKKSFAFICKSITLPDRLTYSNQVNIEHNCDKK
jgi:hypothetical protein